MEGRASLPARGIASNDPVLSLNAWVAVACCVQVVAWSVAHADEPSGTHQDITIQPAKLRAGSKSWVYNPY